MDPLTQGVVGAIATQAIARPGEHRTAAVLGFVTATLADLDVLIRSAEDPLLFLEYHRQFTHSLFFIPIAAACLVALLHPLRSLRVGAFLRHIDPRRLWILLAVAYGTHGLLDACTTYGTSLLWPLSEVRVAWNLVGVVDPGVTLPAALLMIVAWRRRSARWGRVAVAWVLAYLCLGLVQRERAETLLHRVAEARGDVATRAIVKPTLLNLALWRGVWRTDDRGRGVYHVAALRPGLFGPDRTSFVSRGAALDLGRDLPSLESDSVAARDIERFRHFSDDWLVAVERDEDGRLLIGDCRYALLPDQIRPLWGIRVDSSRPDRHVEFLTLREVTPETLPRLRRMIFGGELPVFE
ncbi:MAG: metal-dependent hydrolase [Thermoanaerobaculia bacterium]|nr:metal-dependent hydrolase [Thermoanaerobaculia bacterium]